MVLVPFVECDVAISWSWFLLWNVRLQYYGILVPFLERDAAIACEWFCLRRRNLQYHKSSSSKDVMTAWDYDGVALILESGHRIDSSSDV